MPSIHAAGITTLGYRTCQDFIALFQLPVDFIRGTFHLAVTRQIHKFTHDCLRPWQLTDPLQRQAR